MLVFKDKIIRCYLFCISSYQSSLGLQRNSQFQMFYFQGRHFSTFPTLPAGAWVPPDLCDSLLTCKFLEWPFLTIHGCCMQDTCPLTHDSLFSALTAAHKGTDPFTHCL